MTFNTSLTSSARTKTLAKLVRTIQSSRMTVSEVCILSLIADNDGITVSGIHEQIIPMTERQIRNRLWDLEKHDYIKKVMVTDPINSGFNGPFLELYVTSKGRRLLGLK